MMRRIIDINDAPVEEFYPKCCECGEEISGDGYELNGDYYCEDCMNSHSIDGYKEAEGLREAAWESAHPSDYD